MIVALKEFKENVTRLPLVAFFDINLRQQGVLPNCCQMKKDDMKALKMLNL